MDFGIFRPFQLLFLMLCLPGCGKQAEIGEFRLQGRAMGTAWSLRYVGEEDAALAAKIAGRLEELESIFSTWREGSLVSRLNRGEEVELPAEYVEVAALAEVVRVASGGAFDVRVGEAVRLAGFGSEFSGRLDFSGIAKGFALDQVADVLRRAGVEEFLFEFGGELLGAGVAREWRVGLEKPDPAKVGEVGKVITLRDAAVATSGTYRLFNGAGNHLIDPRTGAAVAHNCVSVSVVADSCAEADAWATALVVLGADEGMAVARREGLRAYFVRRSPDGGYQRVDSGGGSPG